MWVHKVSSQTRSHWECKQFYRHYPVNSIRNGKRTEDLPTTQQNDGKVNEKTPVITNQAQENSDLSANSYELNKENEAESI